MGTLVVAMAFLSIGVAVVEGGESLCHRIARWHEDRKLFRQNRKAMRTYT